MKTKLLLLLIALATGHSGLRAQESGFIVYFAGKDQSEYSLSRPQEFLSHRAIQRRLRQRIPLDSSDLPVSPAYLEELGKISGVRVRYASRWFNFALVELSDGAALTDIASLPFVRSFESVAHDEGSSRRRSALASLPAGNDSLEGCPRDCGIRGSIPGGNDALKDEIFFQPDLSLAPQSTDYGISGAQIRLHKGDYLHTQGFTGAGILIAVLDAGFFNYRENAAFDSLRQQNRILATYDFVQEETAVEDDHFHGLNVLSVLAANLPGQMVGSAPHASYLLYRTEDAATEKPLEEVYWLLAAEAADSAGADIISSSLGYIQFDDPVYNHAYADRDGNTSLITRAADRAVSKGMLVVNASGNSGAASDHQKYVMCPADGDSVLAVGAVNTAGQIAGFSCIGPNGAGLRKPDVVSVGWGAAHVNAGGTPATGNGTSYAAPNLAGLAACLWQAFPECSAVEVLRAIRESGDRFLNPDDQYGFGLPDFEQAFNRLRQTLRDRRSATLGNAWIKVFPLPFHRRITLLIRPPSGGTGRFRVHDPNGRLIHQFELPLVQDKDLIREIDLPAMLPGIYYLQATVGPYQHTVPLPAAK